MGMVVARQARYTVGLGDSFLPFSQVIAQFVNTQRRLLTIVACFCVIFTQRVTI